MKIMDRDKAMELIGNDSSDIEIKFKFYKDLVEEYFPAGCSLKGEENCRKAGKLFVEGPSYICQDGDILFYHIRKLSVCFPKGLL